ncbi:MAG: hypothetical protein EOP09_13845 [Proteobacteria bacterium]|nr:MAG: hypothetical protein EOP09_13845 [Pseudomonadota bacterium]
MKVPRQDETKLSFISDLPFSIGQYYIATFKSLYKISKNKKEKLDSRRFVFMSISYAEAFCFQLK